MVRIWILGIVLLPQFRVVKAAAGLLGTHIPGGVVQGDEEAQRRLFPLHHALEVADLGRGDPPSLDLTVQRGICPGCGYTSPATCALRWTTSWRWPTTGRRRSGTCSCCAATATVLKGLRERTGNRLKMAELRADNVVTGVMVDEGLAALTGKRLARYHRESQDVEPRQRGG